MRIVIDTNVLASAIFFGGKPYQLLRHIMEERVDVVASKDIVDEYEEIVLRLKQKYPARSKLKIFSRERDMQRVSTLQEDMRLLKNSLGYEKIDEIRKHFNEETPVPDGLHVPLNDLFRKYAVVGGMPEAVNTFLETNNISDVYEVQQNIIEEYKDDMVKYPQLAKENKKAQYSVVKRCLPS